MVAMSKYQFWPLCIAGKNLKTSQNTYIFKSSLRNSCYFCFQVAGYLRREGMSNGEGDESHNMLLQEIFHEEDKNKDGFISHEEFQGIKHHEL